MKYEPFAELLKPYWGLPLSGVPVALSTRTIVEGVYSLWGGWDALGPEGRQSVAEGHDAMLDPARKGERESRCKLTQEIDQCLESIALWETMHPQSITEAGAKEAKLTTLTAELAVLQQRLFAPFSALTAPVTEPDQSTPMTEPVATVSAVDLLTVTTVPTAPSWDLISPPTRIPGYRWPLYQFLQAAHVAGKPCPKAQDVLDAWKLKSPLGLSVIKSGRHDALEYALTHGGKKPADLKAIQAAISSLVV